MQSMTGWTKNLKEIPEVDVGTVKKYLLASQNEEFSKDNMKNYKLSRSYAHLNARSINNIMFNPMEYSNTFCAIKAQCLPSQSTENRRVKWLHVILDKSTGEPYGAFCVCTVGRGQACSHVGALLFLLCDLVANGDEQIPDDLSCTDVLCQWTEPKKALVTPKVLEDVEIGLGETCSRPTVSEYAHRVAPQLNREENYQRVLKLIYDVQNANDAAHMPPVVNIIDVARFRTNPLPDPAVITSLPVSCTDFDLAYCEEACVVSRPLPVARLPHENLSSTSSVGYETGKKTFLMSVVYTVRELHEIEKTTRNQFNNDEWFEQRKACITASKVGKIVSFMKTGRANPDLIVKDIMQYNINKSLHLKVPALAWGLKYEEKALKTYVSDLAKAGHVNVTMLRPGLLVMLRSPYIRASPDALVNCECHGQRLVEVKCPYSVRSEEPNKSVKSGKLDYIQVTEDDKYTLKKGQYRGYYEQLTVQQAVAGIENADLLIWTKKGYIVIPVKYDEAYFEDIIYSSVTLFFKDYIVPELLTGRIASMKSNGGTGKARVQPTYQFPTAPSEASSECADMEIEIESQNIVSSKCADDNMEIETESQNIADCENTNMCVSEDNSETSPKSTVTDESGDWVLGCESYCRDNKAPIYSKVKGQLIKCDINQCCEQNTWYHFFCEGFRRMPSDQLLQGQYACKKCRILDQQNVLIDGFLQ